MPRLQPLPPDEPSHPERGHRVRPPPADERVQPDAGERDERQPETGRGLEGVGLERPATERRRRTALRPGEPDHGDEGHRREADADRARARPVAMPERQAGVHGDVGSEQEQRGAHQLLGPLLDSFDGVVVHPAPLGGESPDEPIPEAHSTKLSTPRPRSATEPASSAAATPTPPSTRFQPTVRYSSFRARRSEPARASRTTLGTVMFGSLPRSAGACHGLPGGRRSFTSCSGTRLFVPR